MLPLVAASKHLLASLASTCTVVRLPGVLQSMTVQLTASTSPSIGDSVAVGMGAGQRVGVVVVNGQITEAGPHLGEA